MICAVICSSLMNCEERSRPPVPKSRFPFCVPEGGHAPLFTLKWIVARRSPSKAEPFSKSLLAHYFPWQAIGVQPLLIIDDEGIILFAISKYFTMHGYEVECALQVDQAKAVLVQAR